MRVVAIGLCGLALSCGGSTPASEPAPAPASSGDVVVASANVNGTPEPEPVSAGPLELDFSGTAGGPLPGSSIGPVTCTSYVTVSPSHTFWAGEAYPTLTFTAASMTDTVMIVRSPSGVMTCNDDGGGYPNPLVTVAGEVGRYEIWMGTFSMGASGSYTLHVSSTSSGGGGLGGLAGLLGGTPIPGVPTHCGMVVPDYGPITIGTSVVLGSHTGWTGPDGHGGYVSADTWWNDSMWAYVGQRTVVTELGGLDPAGCPYVRTAIDGGSWGWRIRNLSP